MPVAFPYFGGIEHEHFVHSAHDKLQVRNLPARRIRLADGSEALVATVFDLIAANYG